MKKRREKKKRKGNCAEERAYVYSLKLLSTTICLPKTLCMIMRGELMTKSKPDKTLIIKKKKGKEMGDVGGLRVLLKCWVIRLLYTSIKVFLRGI